MNLSVFKMLGTLAFTLSLIACGKGYQSFGNGAEGAGGTALYGSTGQAETHEDQSHQDLGGSSTEPTHELYGFVEAIELMERVEHATGGAIQVASCGGTDAQILSAIKTILDRVLITFRTLQAHTDDPEKLAHLARLIERTNAVLQRLEVSAEFRQAVIGAERAKCEASDGGSDQTGAGGTAENDAYVRNMVDQISAMFAGLVQGNLPIDGMCLLTDAQVLEKARMTAMTLVEKLETLRLHTENVEIRQRIVALQDRIEVFARSLVNAGSEPTAAQRELLAEVRQICETK